MQDAQLSKTRLGTTRLGLTLVRPTVLGPQENDAGMHFWLQDMTLSSGSQLGGRTEVLPDPRI